tara:strand:+ start:3640 stop:4836 length:1197 start_codon:yes stop_codon:yes gene_type:complete
MKKFKISIFVVLVILIVIVAVKAENLKRLYYAMTLFDKELIVDNFSNMASLFPSTEIEATTNASTFDQDLKPLPSHYKYKNNDRSVPDFLDKTSTTALLVVKGNTITYESYFQGTTGKDYRISWSTAKSFLSALFGIAVHEGTIKSIEEPVTNYVPELINTGYDGVRIKDVLQMSSGVHFNEDYYDFDSDINRFGRTFALGGSFDEFAATLVRDKTPGTYLHYVSIDTHVLGMVIRAATGRSIVDYFNEKLWSKIQPESSVYYIVDNKNEPMVLGGMNLRTRDFARFGQLYLNNGNWKGEQVVPRDWVQASITPDAPHLIPGKRESAKLNLGYGYQWWIPEESDQEFLALGIYGQYIYVNQKSGVVIVKNSAHIEFAENDFESATEAVAFFRAVAESI